MRERTQVSIDEQFDWKAPEGKIVSSGVLRTDTEVLRNKVLANKKAMRIIKAAGKNRK